MDYNSCSKGGSNFKFEITSEHNITPWIVWHEVQLLIINHNYNKIREEYDSHCGINYLTG